MKDVAKLTNFTTPTGQKGNILDPKDWMSMILGVMVLLVTFALGQKFTGVLGEKASFVDTSIEKPYDDPQPQKEEKGKVWL